MFFVYWMLAFCLAMILVFVVFLVAKNSNTKTNCTRNEQLNKKAIEYLKDNNIKVSKTVYLSDYWTYNRADICKKQISVSADCKKIALMDYESQKLSVVDFANIVNYEIYENGSHATYGGGVAGVWSGIFGAETTGMTRDLRLIIRLNTYEKPQIVYDIISKTPLNIGVSKTSDIYSNCISTLQEAVSLLEVIKQENKGNSK